MGHVMCIRTVKFIKSTRQSAGEKKIESTVYITSIFLTNNLGLIIMNHLFQTFCILNFGQEAILFWLNKNKKHPALS